MSSTPSTWKDFSITSSARFFFSSCTVSSWNENRLNAFCPALFSPFSSCASRPSTTPTTISHIFTKPSSPTDVTRRFSSSYSILRTAPACAFTTTSSTLVSMLYTATLPSA